MNQSGNQRKEAVGVIGAGSFGMAISNLLAHNVDVVVFSRKAEIVDKINREHRHLNLDLSPRIRASNNLEEIAEECRLIFPIVPSNSFRDMMKSISPYLKPYHLLIHGTKGFDTTGVTEESMRKDGLTRKQVHTMSEVIRQESVVVRIGCLSGPNLSVEIMAGQPTATVIGSKFTEVIKKGRRVLDSSKFHVFGTYELLGAELAGALKNSIAIGSGILGGLGLGKNIQAMLITRGLMEMVNLGKAMGATSQAFIGTAGIGDLVATATSNKSRNYTFGERLASGDSIDHIKATMPELAEGVRTIQIMKHLAAHFKLRMPITEMMHAVVFSGFEIEKAIEYLMTYPYAVDVDIL